MTDSRSAERRVTDPLLVTLADYVCSDILFSDETFAAARLCLLDALGCAFLALNDDACVQRLGPIVPGAELPGGARVPGTQYELDPVRACFNTGCLIRWLDYNDTWLAAEWGHPSDNLAAILACGDYLDRSGQRALTMHDILIALVKAYEIQGVLALENAFNQQGLDHVLLVRIASAAVCARLLGGNHQQVMNALSNALADGGALRVYRHAPNTGWRKSWAAGDAASRGVQHALMAVKDEMGCPSVLSTTRWGFESVLMDGGPVRLSQPLADNVIKNILFKVSFPAEFHAQTAVECGIALHKVLPRRLDKIAHIKLFTQAAGKRIIDKRGLLDNPADRDHCLQYAVAVALLKGDLQASDYADVAAADPRIDDLRDKITVFEDPQFSDDYMDPEKRAIANRVEITLKDGREFIREQAYPLGHPRRREEAMPLLLRKFEDSAIAVLGAESAVRLKGVMLDSQQLDVMSVEDFMALLIPQESVK
ncbi:MAG: bifunctional 2-methylcitrate dehydratase/aconitate hydratase [Pseudomonadales bacterium]